jgi:hypothetical protein
VSIIEVIKEQYGCDDEGGLMLMKKNKERRREKKGPFVDVGYSGRLCINWFHQTTRGFYFQLWSRNIKFKLESATRYYCGQKRLLSMLIRRRRVFSTPADPEPLHTLREILRHPRLFKSDTLGY